MISAQELRKKQKDSINKKENAKLISEGTERMLHIIEKYLENTVAQYTITLQTFSKSSLVDNANIKACLTTDVFSNVFLELQLKGFEVRVDEQTFTVSWEEKPDTNMGYSG
jgi:hypothetical protein